MDDIKLEDLATEAYTVLSRMFPDVKVGCKPLFDDGEGNDVVGVWIGDLFSVFPVSATVVTGNRAIPTTQWKVEVYADPGEPFEFGSYRSPWVALGDIAAEMARFQVENELEMIGLEKDVAEEAPEPTEDTPIKPVSWDEQKIRVLCASNCYVCGKIVEEDSDAMWVRGKGLRHLRCGCKEEPKPEGERIIVWGDHTCPGCGTEIKQDSEAYWVRAQGPSGGVYCLDCAPTKGTL